MKPKGINSGMVLGRLTGFAAAGRVSVPKVCSDSKGGASAHAGVLSHMAHLGSTSIARKATIIDCPPSRIDGSALPTSVANLGFVRTITRNTDGVGRVVGSHNVDNRVWRDQLNIREIRWWVQVRCGRRWGVSKPIL